MSGRLPKMSHFAAKIKECCPRVHGWRLNSQKKAGSDKAVLANLLAMQRNAL
jgi:hypothetical protein